MKTVKQQAAAPIPKGTKRTKGNVEEAEHPKTRASGKRQIGPQYAKKTSGKSNIMKDVWSGLVCRRFHVLFVCVCVCVCVVLCCSLLCCCMLLLFENHITDPVPGRLVQLCRCGGIFKARIEAGGNKITIRDVECCFH